MDIRNVSARKLKEVLRPGLTSEPAPTTDANLIRAVARGDEASFASLYDRHSPILLGLLIRILQSRAEAEDVLQEVFLQVWQQAANFDESRGAAFTWLVTLTRSRAIDRLRQLESRRRTSAEAARDAPQQIDDTMERAIGREQREVVERALAQIPEGQRLAILLAYFEGLTQSQIAQRLGEPLGTIKTRVRAGLGKLQELLSEQQLGNKG